MDSWFRDVVLCAFRVFADFRSRAAGTAHPDRGVCVGSGDPFRLDRRLEVPLFRFPSSVLGICYGLWSLRDHPPLPRRAAARYLTAPPGNRAFGLERGYIRTSRLARENPDGARFVGTTGAAVGITGLPDRHRLRMAGTVAAERSPDELRGCFGERVLRDIPDSTPRVRDPTANSRPVRYLGVATAGRPERGNVRPRGLASPPLGGAPPFKMAPWFSAQEAGSGRSRLVNPRHAIYRSRFLR